MAVLRVSTDITKDKTILRMTCFRWAADNHYCGFGYDSGVFGNLNFFPSIYTHLAPRHDNFGRIVSHGCVSAAKANAEWIYNWAEVGTSVAVHD